jgi:DNA-binding transcriptional ArsR family regulator
MEPTLKLVVISKAISCPTRVFILGLLGPEGCTVSEAAETAGVSASTASYHLQRLEGAGLVQMKRRGRAHVYGWGKNRWYLMCQDASETVAITNATSGTT